jgi:hypothetical protein
MDDPLPEIAVDGVTEEEAFLRSFLTTPQQRAEWASLSLREQMQRIQSPPKRARRSTERLTADTLRAPSVVRSGNARGANAKKARPDRLARVAACAQAVVAARARLLVPEPESDSEPEPETTVILEAVRVPSPEIPPKKRVAYAHASWRVHKSPGA